MVTDEDKIRVLKLARKRLVKRRSSFICWALDGATYRRPANKAAVAALRTYIEKALDGAAQLEVWQVWHGIEWNRSAQEDRIAWVDWMIECLEGKR